jgi:hypothetical protein
MDAEFSRGGQGAYLDPDPGWRHDGGLPDFPGPWRPIRQCSGCGTVYTGGTHTCQSLARAADAPIQVRRRGPHLADGTEAGR